MSSQSPWIVGLCSVVFDVDYGQKVDYVIPNDCLSDAERTDVGFNSFPDSLSMELQTRSSIRDSSFFFRIRRRSQSAAQDTDKFLYGFVFCRQRYDDRLRRGGEQSSVVVLSQLPFTSVLRPLSQIAGPLFFNEGPAALERVYKEVLAWPLPRVGPLMQLPVAMVSISAHVPSFQAAPHPHFASKDSAQLLTMARRNSRASVNGSLDAPGSTHGSRAGLSRASSIDRDRDTPPHPPSEPSFSPTSASLAQLSLLPSTPSTTTTMPSLPSPSMSRSPSSNSRSSLRTSTSGALTESGSAPDPSTLSFFSDFDIFTPLQGVLPQLWTLWELLVTGQPLIVAAPSPGEASSAVCALISLLSPLPYSGDFRPYYTIHDSSFRLLSSLPQAPTADGLLPSLIGITNVFFVKALQNWQNVLAVGTKAPTTAWSGANGAGGGLGRGTPPPPKKRQAGPQQLLSEHTEKLWTSHKPLLRSDSALLNRLARPNTADAKARAKAATVNSDALRRHFSDLTTAFLAPFSPYHLPGPNGRVQPWDPPAFLAGIRTNKPPKPLLDRLNGNVGSAVEMYRRFLEAPTFKAWFSQQHQQVAHLVDSSGGAGSGGGTAALLPQQSFKQAMQHMDEVQLVQAFYSLETQLAAAMEAAEKAPDAGAAAWGRVERLKLELSAVLAAMPEDLQATMASSPTRQQLLRTLQSADPHHAAMFASLLARLQS